MAYVHRPPKSAPTASLKPLIAGGILFAGLGFLVDFQGIRQWVSRSDPAPPG